MNLIGEFVRAAESEISSLLSESGKILYSAAGTLTRGDLYVLGLNPGGDREHPNSHSIEESLYALPEKISNDYLDEAWARPKGKPFRPGRHPLQRNLRSLFDSLSWDLRSTCSSNLIFVRSKDAAKIDFAYYADICWPVHEMILEVVQPQTILAFGNSTCSPFFYLHDKFGQEEEPIAVFPSGRGSWLLKAFRGIYKGAQVNVLGVPHLSWYSAKRRPDQIQWLRERLAA